MAAAKKPSENPKAVEPPKAAARNLRGAFCNLDKYGGSGWGISIEEDGDIEPGMVIDVKRKDGEVKPITIDDVIYQDSYKVVCTVLPDPNDRPPGGRSGNAKRRGGGDMGGDGAGRGDRSGRGSSVKGSKGKGSRSSGSSSSSSPKGKGSKAKSSSSSSSSDPRALRQGAVRFSGESIDLGGVHVARGLVDFEKLLDLGD